VRVDQPLAQFTDRNTMVYERHYPHDIELVFEAVSTGEHLDVWMLPESRVERREGGACAFGWGSSADDPMASKGVVTIYDPPKVVEYTFEDQSYMRFDLAPDGEGTRLLFTLHFVPEPGAEDHPYPGGDLPAPGTAWRPGFLSGYHGMLDDLREYLAGTYDAEIKARAVAEGHDAGPDFERFTDLYREHIRAHCPSE
jgi:uncharacterized protein YndB with AHSA1/START domain